jgi:choice-of-anchor B domain-containing protein
MKINILPLAFLLFAATQRAEGQTPCENGMAGAYPCNNVDLLSKMTLSQLGGGQNTNDIWGWVSPVTGKEYAIVGMSNGTAFVDISDPVSPQYLGLLPTHTQNSLWRDVETYGDYLFVGSEASGHGLQVMHLLQLDNVSNPPVIFGESEHYAGFGNSHTINIDPVSGYCVAYGSNTFSGGPHIVNIQDPLNPVIAGGFSEDGYTHDGFIVTYYGPDQDKQGRVILVLCNADALTIADCTDPADCFMLDTYTYPQTGYVHQGWFTKDFRYFLVNDELDETNFSVGTRTHLFDLQDLDNIVYLGYHQTNNSAIDHNLYIRDQFVYQSNYRSGLRIFDVSRVADAQLVPVGFFDLYPNNDYPNFSGTWSNYPFLPSGVNIATSMYDGFYILKPNLLELAEDRFDLCGQNSVTLNLDITANLQFPLTVDISGLDEAVSLSAPLISGPGEYQIFLGNISQAAPGAYEATLELHTTFGEMYELPVFFEVTSGASTPFLAEPENGAIVSNGVSSIGFFWSAEGVMTSYHFQLAYDAAFENIMIDETVEATEYMHPFALPDGDYFWRVAAVNECGQGAWSDAFQFSSGFVGVEEMPESRLEVYPNPATELLMIRWNGKFGNAEILDATGRLCETVFIPAGGKAMADIRHLAPGFYQVRLGTNSARWIKK